MYYEEADEAESPLFERRNIDCLWQKDVCFFEPCSLQNAAFAQKPFSNT